MKTTVKLAGLLLGASLLSSCATPPPPATILPQADNTNYVVSGGNDPQTALKSAIDQATAYCQKMQRKMVVIGQPKTEKGEKQSDAVKMTDTITAAVMKYSTYNILQGHFNTSGDSQITVQFRCE